MVLFMIFLGGAEMRRLLPTVKTCINIFMESLSLRTHETTINIYEI